MTICAIVHGRRADHLRRQLLLQHVLRPASAAAIRGTPTAWNGTAPSPPGHGNFDFQPIVYRGPYEYGSPEVDDRLLPADPAAAATEHAEPGDALHAEAADGRVALADSSLHCIAFVTHRQSMNATSTRLEAPGRIAGGGCWCARRFR